ncbi:flagellar export chaperone FliS [Arthrobacter sp. H16F315]|uniref:flagellar export chaperone FliS n=1 Tax=Arthrobacter sp. H16F315 TaxID=2955314 RepID=UPI002096AC9D|nr:flagellar export chaperone FliS [Arthrobacter sp. H16F315]MDD1475665.1 flagellar export chaperone FliS [Arthrobacter sp. H16F315]
MTTTFGAAQRAQYLNDSVLSASPARLLTLLYDRLLLDLGRAESAQRDSNWSVASENLLHAQAIISELGSSLKTDAWSGADGLLGLYNYVSTALVNANIQRDPMLTREAIDLLEPLRQAWHEASGALPAANTAPAPTAAGPTAPAFAAAPARSFAAAGAWNPHTGNGGGSLGFG